MDRRIFPTTATKAWAISVLLCLAAVGHFAGGFTGSVVLCVSLLCAVFLVVARFEMFSKRFATTRNDSRTKPFLQVLAQKQVGGSLSGLTNATLGAAFKRERWKQADTIVDEILDTCIAIIDRNLNAHTVAIFFPTIDSGFTLRRHRSRSDQVVESATITPGLGVLGGLLKNGLKNLYLRDISNDSTTLYFYHRDVGIRSLIACPVFADSEERGILVVDSTEKGAFTEEHIAFVSLVATLLGQAVFSTYLHTEHSIEHQRLIQISTIEKEFFSYQSIDKVLDILIEVIPFALTCDRLTISMRSDNDKTAAIMRTYGMHADELLNKRFQLGEKTLASILYGKNICFSRAFAHDRYETRYFEREPRNEGFVSFLAMPVGVENCKGMILIESMKRDDFTEANREILSRIATSASLAIEKILIIEKANSMATHDGLTGLFNHRQFQQLLGDEITRSIRYSDPLALVLCDIDFFKKVNDTWGHQFGDTVLREIAKTLDTSIRQGIDTAARYGGEEFALILVKTDEAQAIETAERIRASIERIVFKSPSGNDVHVTMSFGIALYGIHARASDELIKKSDKALYRAKEHGRNRFEVF